MAASEPAAVESKWAGVSPEVKAIALEFGAPRKVGVGCPLPPLLPRPLDCPLTRPSPLPSS